MEESNNIYVDIENSSNILNNNDDELFQCTSDQDLLKNNENQFLNEQYIQGNNNQELSNKKNRNFLSANSKSSSMKSNHQPKSISQNQFVTTYFSPENNDLNGDFQIFQENIEQIETENNVISQSGKKVFPSEKKKKNQQDYSIKKLNSNLDDEEQEEEQKINTQEKNTHNYNIFISQSQNQNNQFSDIPSPQFSANKQQNQIFVENNSMINYNNKNQQFQQQNFPQYVNMQQQSKCLDFRTGIQEENELFEEENEEIYNEYIKKNNSNNSNYDDQHQNINQNEISFNSQYGFSNQKEEQLKDNYNSANSIGTNQNTNNLYNPQIQQYQQYSHQYQQNPNQNYQFCPQNFNLNKQLNPLFIDKENPTNLSNTSNGTTSTNCGNNNISGFGFTPYKNVRNQNQMRSPLFDITPGSKQKKERDLDSSGQKMRNMLYLFQSPINHNKGSSSSKKNKISDFR
ncbi:hypothetical protein PPERSA_05949 [Pseudocohnilembus persalinus]|uniref:Uncharacterized protein n=1 Tax=Pseudocohnilembus persalinus TaxID=266149 RepID=A0A0V0R4J6_PSEPJ|nr:hypothetical protein PPERSA_05949 [Pseudocohnilembus persalinus]|eukprot:KRX09280.1 hypothetical protein PPERSA_05949 [Pseudocohnilembus persalinus]